jgi:hypothetical protein
MSRNTLRGLGKSGGHKGTRENASQSSDPSRSHPVVQTKAIQELTPEELKERIKEELRKIRELDSPDPNTAKADRSGAVSISAAGKEPSLSSTIMGMPLPPSLSSKTILVTGMSEPRGGERAPDLASIALANAASGVATEELLEEKTDREPIRTISAEAARLRGTSFGRDLHLPGILSGKASSRASEEVIIAEEVFPAPPPGREPRGEAPRAGAPRDEASADEPRGHSGRELALRAEVAVPQRLDWEPTDVNPVGAPSAWAVPGEHDADHLPWYDQAPPQEEIYEEPKGRVPLGARKTIGVVLGVSLALGTFYLIRMNGGLRSRPAGIDINALVNRPAAVGPAAGTSIESATPRATGSIAPVPVIGTTADVTRLRGGPDAPGTMPGSTARASRSARPEGPGRTTAGSLGEAPARAVGPAGVGSGTQRGNIPRVPLRPPTTVVVRPPAGPANRSPGTDVGPGRSDAKQLRRVVSDGLLRLDARGRPGTSFSQSPAAPPPTRGASTGLPGPGTSPWGQGARGLPGQGPPAGNPGGGPAVGQSSTQEPTGTARPGTISPRPKPSYDPDSTLPLNGE